MKLRLIMTIVILCTGLPFAWPQGKGGQGGRGQQSGQSQGQQRSPGGSERGYGDIERERDRIHVSQKQRDQLRTCDRSADAVRDQARQMGKYGQGAAFNADKARQDRDRLQEQVRTMQQEHERLMQGMNPGQQQALESHIRNLNRLQERLNTRMQNLNGELGKADPDAKRVAEQAREMERVSKEWKEQYRSIQDRITVEP